MTVIKNQKSNTYEVRTYYKDWTGVRKQKTKRGFKRKCDAQEWERAFKLKENLSLDMYFEDFVDLYLNDIKSRIKYNTWLTKKHIVEKKILPYFSKKKLQEIKPSDIRQWQNTMMNYRNKQGEGYSQVYLKTIHNQLSAILNHAVNFYDLKSNAARKAGSMGKERTKEMLFWTKEEYMKFIEAVADKNNMQVGVEIGCIILDNVFFLDKLIDEPIDWSKSIVSGKRYTTDTEIGAELFDKVNDALASNAKTNIEIIEEIEKEIDELDLWGEERLAIVKTRVNQSVFRDSLLKKYKTCCLCKVENPSLLIASHIKPWAVSEPGEKLDPQNGFLLCPNHDALFDGGYITFENDGQIVISDRLSMMDCTFMNVQPTMKINLSEENKKYLNYHRKKIFK